MRVSPIYIRVKKNRVFNEICKDVVENTTIFRRYTFNNDKAFKGVSSLKKMNKLISVMLLSLVMISMVGLVSADTLIGGKIYNADFTDTISGADVTVSCSDGDAEPCVQYTTSLDDGAYSVVYDEDDNEDYCSCDNGYDLTVSAIKNELSGSATGEIHDNMVGNLDVGIVNVPLVPEFGVVVGFLTMISAIGVFFVIRKK